jgi:hypothetical protein
MMTMKSKTLLLALTFSSALLACERSQAGPGEASASTASVTRASPATPGAPKVTKIVFVGKEHACDCTRKTVDAGWAALQSALGTPAKVPVERLQIDTDAARVEPYRGQRPIMALPAIYFVEGAGNVIDLLQGEVTQEQIAGSLGATP